MPLQWQSDPIATHASVGLPFAWKTVHLLTTDRYLTAVERRLQDLERLVAERLPDVNIDEILAASSRLRAGSISTPTLAPTDQISSPGPQQLHPIEVKNSNEEEPRAISEAVPDAADGFDWQEEANDLADGMAALSVEPTGTGYLGQSHVVNRHHRHHRY